MSEPKKYRKKPVEIEALQYTGENGAEVGLFVGEADRNDDNQFLIHTLEGTMAADPGDWIIRGVQGEFYPCKPDIFEATYKAVTMTGQDPRAVITRMKKQFEQLGGDDGAHDEILEQEAIDDVLMTAPHLAAALEAVLEHLLKAEQLEPWQSRDTGEVYTDAAWEILIDDLRDVITENLEADHD